MTAAISPVNAPTLCSLMFCAPRRMFLESRMALDTDSSAVKGGQTTMSTSFTLLRSRLRSSTSDTASATVLFIFQLPAMISLRSLFMDERREKLFVRKRRHAGQLRAFKEFQARAAAGAHKSHLVAEAGLVQRLHAVAAADDALGAVLLRGVHHGLRHSICAGGETLVFKNPHRPVPEN